MVGSTYAACLNDEKGLSLPVEDRMAEVADSLRPYEDPVVFLRRMIMSGEFKPGERLPTERKLATQLGCSRGSIREAIRQLSALNLVMSRQGDGTYVTSLSSEELVQPLAAALRLRPESIMHLLELRLVIEPWIAAGAAARISDESRVELQDLVKKYDESVITEAEAELIAIDERIHEIIAEAHGNALFLTILQALRDAAREGRSITVAIHEGLPSSASELRLLVDAVVKGDSMRAQIAMSSHIFHAEAYAEAALSNDSRSPGVRSMDRRSSLKR